MMSFAIKRNRVEESGEATTGLCLPIILHARLYSVSSRAKVAGAANDNGEASDTICVVTNAAVSFFIQRVEAFCFPWVEK